MVYWLLKAGIDLKGIKLACLEEWGVDNWEGWSDAMHDYHKEKGTPR